MIRCTACGTENPPGSLHCSGCARKLDLASQQSVVEQREAHTATGVRWSAVLIAAVIVILLILLIVLFATGVL